jgi:hypothetical protein
MNLPEGTHLAFTDYRHAWYDMKERAIDISAADDSGQGSAWGFIVAEVDTGEHGTAIQVRVFEGAFAAFTAILEFFASLDGVTTLDGVAELLQVLGATDETVTEPPVPHEASAVDKAAAVIRNHPWPRDYKEARTLAAAILDEARP